MLYGYYDQDSNVRDSNNSPWLGSVRDGRDDKPTHKLVRPAPPRRREASPILAPEAMPVRAGNDMAPGRRLPRAAHLLGAPPGATVLILGEPPCYLLGWRFGDRASMCPFCFTWSRELEALHGRPAEYSCCCLHRKLLLPRTQLRLGII